RDITERKAAQRELLLLNRALDNAFDATYLVDADMRLRYANEAAVRALGYSREELLSMTLPDIDPNLKPEMLKALMMQTDTLGRFPGIVETQHRRKDGSVFPIEVGATVFDYEGERLHLTTVRDITERKAAEDALRASEEKYRKLISKIRAAVVVHGADTQVLISNPVAQEILGLTEEQLQGKIAIDPAWHFFREDASPMSQEDYPVNKVLASRQPLSNYVMGIHRPAQAEDVWVLVNAVPVFGINGEITQVIVTFIDITQLKHAEAALVARERELRAERGLFVGGPTVVFKWLAKEGWPVEYVSPNIADQLGYAPEDLTSGKFLFGAIVHPDDRARVAAEVAAYSAQGRATFEQVYRIASADGSYRWIDDFTVVGRGEDGGITHYHGYVMDITAQKLAEAALREREQRYHEIFDNATEGMYLLEVTEDGRFRNLDINPALERSTGVPSEAMVGKFVDEVVPGEAGRLSVEKYRRCVAAGKTIEESIELDLPVGKRYYYSTITPIYYDGRIHRLIGISRDITELKRAERELEESRAQLRGLTARREEVREEERKYIAREVHDELGQILTGLQLNVSVLLHKFAADASPLRDQLQETMQLTDRALGVARNVASALRPAALDMGIVSALEWLAARFSLNTGIKCEVHVEELEIPLDEPHAIALFRIVQESLTNIARHAQASRADISLIRDEDEYSLKVRDNGAGFDQKMKKADSFGLVGMRERALLLGGEVIINSKPGEGTEVEVRIPAHQTEELL
ncbi:MAG TPA: PAS domain S-box protein, partial [Gallionella sp.]|nr:PAS domain S-box protein [Gallionella sp.]